MLLSFMTSLGVHLEEVVFVVFKRKKLPDLLLPLDGRLRGVLVEII